MAEHLDDPAVVAREYASEERMLRRRLDFWADFRAPDPDDVAIAALRETSPQRVLEIGPAAKPPVRASGPGEGVWGNREIPPPPGYALDVSSRLIELDRALAELARVLRRRGRLVAITYYREHMGELWRRLDRDQLLSFDADTGGALLAGHFARVERRDVRGEVAFRTREALLGYRARVANAVFVAEKA